MEDGAGGARPARGVLTPEGRGPVVVVPGRSGWLLTVEHAGRAVPGRLGDLGLPAGEMDRHIGWDPGALALARVLRDALDATLGFGDLISVPCWHEHTLHFEEDALLLRVSDEPFLRMTGYLRDEHHAVSFDKAI